MATLITFQFNLVRVLLNHLLLTVHIQIIMVSILQEAAHNAVKSMDLLVTKIILMVSLSTLQQMT